MRTKTSEKEQELINQVTWNNVKKPKKDIPEKKPLKKPGNFSERWDKASKNIFWNEEEAKKYGWNGFGDVEQKNKFIDENDPLGLDNIDLGI